MKLKLIVLCTVIGHAFPLMAQPDPVVQWSRTIGGPQGDYAWAVQQVPDGGYAVLGLTDSYPDNRQMYFVRLSATGDSLWARTYGGPGIESGQSLGLTADGGFALFGHSLPVPIAHWSFDEVSGDTAYDLSGQGNHGLLYSVDRSTEGYSGGCVYLNDIFDHADFGDEPFRLAQGTWEMWVKADSGGYGHILSKDNYDYPNDGTLFWLDGTLGLEMHVPPESRPRAYRDSVDLTDWHHVACSWGPAGMRLYFDFQLVAEDPYTGGIISPGRPLIIGRSLDFPAFRGKIDEVKVWNEQLPIPTSSVHSAYLIRCDEDGNSLWTRRFFAEGSDGMDVQVTSDGGLIICGTKSGVGTFDAFTMKLDAQGDSVWGRVYSDDREQKGYAVTEMPDSGYLMLFDDVYYTIGLVRYSANGDTLWTRTYETELGWPEKYAEAWDVEVTSDNQVVIAGMLKDRSSGTEDMLLIKVDGNSGDTVWTHTYGGPGNEYAMAVHQTPDGGFALARYSSSYSNGGRDVWIVRTDPAGNELWSRNYGGPAHDEALDLQLTLDGGYILAGFTQSFGAGGTDFYLIKTGPDTACNSPQSPTVVIQSVYPHAHLHWDPALSIGGCHIAVDAYLVWYSPTSDGQYYFHGYTADTSYTHYGVMAFASGMHYQVQTYLGPIAPLSQLREGQSRERVMAFLSRRD